MSDVKWIKITTDIFDDEKMFAIESLQDGQQIELIWFKLLCLAGKCNNNGFLTIANKIPYTDEMLSKIFRMDLGTVQRAIEVFVRLDMIENIDNTYMVSNWIKHQNVKGLEELKEAHRERQKRYRDKQKLITEKSESDVTVTSQNDVICSYSLSNSISISNSNNNKNNNIYSLLNNLISNYTYSELLTDKIHEWIKYKVERKESYKEQGLKSLLKQIENKANEYGDAKVCDLIDECMANNWKGIIWDKLKDAKPNSSYMNAISNRVNVVDTW